MITAGIDVGSLSTNAVILEDNNILLSHSIRTSHDSMAAGMRVMKESLELLRKINKNITMEEIDNIISTGYGRVQVPFSDSSVTEIACHTRGNHWYFPKVRTILDIGGQDCKVIRCDGDGNVTKFLMNDKCGAGTGRFLERIANTLHIPLQDMGDLSTNILEEPSKINNLCAIYAQQDILTLQRKGENIRNILAAVNKFIVGKVYDLIQKIGIMDQFVMSGGVAKNVGIVKYMEYKIGTKIHMAEDPQIIGALGAAIIARDKLSKKKITKDLRRIK